TDHSRSLAARHLQVGPSDAVLPKRIRRERRSSPCPGQRPARPEDGAFMEPSGRNRWQPVANGTGPKTAQISRSATGGNPRLVREGGRRFESVRGLEVPASAGLQEERVHVGGELAVVLEEKAVGRVRVD